MILTTPWPLTEPIPDPAQHRPYSETYQLTGTTYHHLLPAFFDYIVFPIEDFFAPINNYLCCEDCWRRGWCPRLQRGKFKDNEIELSRLSLQVHTKYHGDLMCNVHLSITNQARAHDLIKQRRRRYWRIRL